MALDLTTKRDRIRLAVGDTSDTAPLMPGGDTPAEKIAIYTSLLALNSDNEIAAWRAAAAALAAFYATQPTSLSDSGSSLNWSDRIAQWNRIADGKAKYPNAGGGAGRGLMMTGAGLDPMFRRTSLGTDPVLEEDAGA